jgi:S1-C subfamily serine protease
MGQPAEESVNVPVSAPIDTDTAGKGGNIAIHSVLRVLCPEKDTGGTGFLHKSGNIITADHVVRDCQTPTTILPDGTRGSAKTIAYDQDHDLVDKI